MPISKANEKAVISTLNSSTTPLGISGVFTGTFENVLSYTNIIVTVKSDQISANDGLQIQWSSDGVNIDATDEFTVPANIGKTYSFGRLTKYFRIVYTNGASPQSFFRLHILLTETNQKPSSHRIQDPISNDDDAELSKAILTGNSNGDFVNVKTTPDGRLQVSSPPPVAPTGTTPVVRSLFTSVTGISDDVYVIPNGETLTITRFSAGAEVDTTAGNAIILYDDPNGDGSVLNVIDVIFASGASGQHDLSEEILGDGVRAIRLRRERLSGGAKRIFGRWEGYQ